MPLLATSFIKEFDIKIQTGSKFLSLTSPDLEVQDVNKVR